MASAIMAVMSPPKDDCGSPIRVRTGMLASISIYYFLIKITFFYSLVRAQVKYDLVRDHYLFLGILYTAAVAFLSLCFLVGWKGQNFPDRQLERYVSQMLGITLWQAWLIETLILSTIYFKLMARFDEGVIFWTLLLLGYIRRDILITFEIDAASRKRGEPGPRSREDRPDEHRVLLSELRLPV